jgi:prevent-host-death family protein
VIYYVSVYDIKVDMSKYLNKLKEGDEVVITKHGVAVAKLTPFSTPKIKLGILQGTEYANVPDEVFETSEEELAEWDTDLFEANN